MLEDFFEEELIRKIDRVLQKYNIEREEEGEKNFLKIYKNSLNYQIYENFF